MDACVQIGSERQYFMMYRNAAQYDNGIRYMFCDELDDYTFLPYKGEPSEIPGYKEDREAFEEIYIFMVTKATEKLVKIPCYVVVELKRIYISELHFNKRWKQMSDGMRRGLYRSKKMKQGEATYVYMNKKVDLSLVETPTRSAFIGRGYTIEYKGKPIDIDIQRMISKKASAMSDHRIRFVYAKSEPYVHDKSCWLVEKIHYSDFGATEQLPEDRELCPRCIRRIWIRNAIKWDTKRFAWYKRFFDEGRVSNRVLEQFLDGTDAKLHMDTMDELTVEYREDTWKIKRNDEGIYELYHNNYVMVSEEERYITSGFHPQKPCPTYLAGVLACIQAYDWQKHLEAKTSSAPEPVAAPEAMTVSEPEEQPTVVKESFVRRILAVVKRAFGR